MGLSTTLKAQVTANLSRVTGNVSVSAPLDLKWTKSLADGILADQANCIYQETLALAALATAVIDLNGLTNDLGQTQTFTGVKSMFFSRPTTDGVSVVSLQANATEGFVAWCGAVGDIIFLHAGGEFMHSNPQGLTGWASVNNTTDKLLLTNTHATIAAAVNIVIVGIGTLA